MDQTNTSPFLSSSKKVALIVIILIALAALSTSFGIYLGKSRENFSNTNQEIKEIFNGIPFSNNIAGKITEINSRENYITLDVPGFTGLNIPRAYRNKKIFFTSDTKFKLLQQLSPEELKKQIDVQQKARLKNPADIKPVMPFTEKEIKLDDLKIGDQINVVIAAKEGTNILDKEFTAAQVIINQSITNLPAASLPIVNPPAPNLPNPAR